MPQIFLFLLRVLDVRAISPPTLLGRTHEVEAAATRAVVALVMKLTESRFKPLYLRLLEWATAAGTEDDGAAEDQGGAAAAKAAALARQATLFGVSGALTERLRSVFVPYFRYLVDKAAKHLDSESSSLTVAVPKAKKQRKGPASDPEGSMASPTAWVLRLRVIRSLHRALLYDSAGFFDSEKLDRLLQPLVSQLEAPPPSEALTAVLEAQCSDGAELDAYVLTGKFLKTKGLAGADRPEAYDTMGVAAVACLVQMGVTANSDVFWKPLNHRVLMCTRGSATVRAKLLALEVVIQLVGRLREEYLVLLPEVRKTAVHS